MEDKWKQSFGSALSDYESDGVDLSWDEVRGAMETAPKKRRILPVFAWSAAAAAAVVAAVILLPRGGAPGGVDFTELDDAALAFIENISENEAIETVAEEPSLLADSSLYEKAAEKAADAARYDVIVTEGEYPGRKSGGNGVLNEARESLEAEESILRRAVESEKALLDGAAEYSLIDDKEKDEAHDPEAVETERIKMQEADAERERSFWRGIAEEEKAASRRGVTVTAGLLGGSTPAGIPSSFGGGDYASLKHPIGYDSVMSDIKDGSHVYGEDEEQTKSGTRAGSVVASDETHYIPVRIGAEVRIGITDRFGIRTGLTYTGLRSVFTETENNIKSENTQTLNYIGIPLAFDWTFFDKSGFRLYLSAGARADFMVRGSMDSKAFSLSSGHEVPYPNPQYGFTLRTFDDPDPAVCQFSLNGSLGVEYTFSRRWGIYMEPGIAWYPDMKSGSTTTSFFTENPLAFDMSLGVRYRFGR